MSFEYEPLLETIAATAAPHAASVDRGNSSARPRPRGGHRRGPRIVGVGAAGWEPSARRQGHAAVVALSRDMDEGRRMRLGRLGFPADDAARLSALHTRNFM